MEASLQKYVKTVVGCLTVSVTQTMSAEHLWAERSKHNATLRVRHKVKVAAEGVRGALKGKMLSAACINILEMTVKPTADTACGY